MPRCFCSLWQYLRVCVCLSFLPFALIPEQKSYICKESTHFKDKSTDRMSAETLGLLSILWSSFSNFTGQFLNVPVMLEQFYSLVGKIRHHLMTQEYVWLLSVRVSSEAPVWLLPWVPVVPELHGDLKFHLNWENLPLYFKLNIFPSQLKFISQMREGSLIITTHTLRIPFSSSSTSEGAACVP